MVRRGTRSRLALALSAVLAAMALAPVAKADEDPGEEHLGPAFRYTVAPSRDYGRALFEQVLILGAGFAEYTSNKAANEPDWDLAPEWSSVESKLLFSSLTFDNNKFDTNWLTHPFAGFLYYSSARGNRLSLPVSLLFASVSSTVWEYVGEIREHAAINDMIATPMTGLALGEPMLQLGALVHRGSQTPGAKVAGWVFAPWKSLHDAIDGLDPEPARERDHFGLPDDVWHRITIGGSAGVTSQSAGLTQGDGRIFGRARIVSVPGYGQAARRHGWFDDGEVTEIGFRTGVASGSLVDLAVEGQVLPIGYAYQDVALDAAGRLRGHGGLVGLHVGASYELHDWDRDRRRAGDRIGAVATGLTVEERVHAGPLTVRARLDGLFDFAGVDAYALPEEKKRRGDARLSSVMRNQGYYHAYGVTLRPRVEAELGAFDAGGELRIDWWSSIDTRDVEPSPGPVIDASDRRTRAGVWMGVRPAPFLRLFAAGEAGRRWGRVGATRDARSEIGAHGGVEVVF